MRVSHKVLGNASESKVYEKPTLLCCIQVSLNIYLGAPVLHNVIICILGSDSRNMKKFLNRLLGLHVRDQVRFPSIGQHIFAIRRCVFNFESNYHPPHFAI